MFILSLLLFLAVDDKGIEGISIMPSIPLIHSHTRGTRSGLVSCLICADDYHLGKFVIATTFVGLH